MKKTISLLTLFCMIALNVNAQFGGLGKNSLIKEQNYPGGASVN